MFGSGTKDVVTKITDVAKTTLGVDNLDAVEKAMAADPAKALEFKQALIAAATEEKRIQMEREKSERETYLASLQATLADVQSARAMAMSNGPVKYGSIVVSILSIVLAAAVAYMLLWPTAESARWTETIVTMLAGAAINWVATVQNFWLGSSQGSHNKDVALAELKAMMIRK
jgi:hypothetical protein